MDPRPLSATDYGAAHSANARAGLTVVAAVPAAVVLAYRAGIAASVAFAPSFFTWRSRCP
jgi:hypothetical protein